jgi:hypothetical protein
MLSTLEFHFNVKKPSYNVDNCLSEAAYEQFECTALIRAAQLGHTDCVRLLLDAGADIAAKGIV